MCPKKILLIFLFILFISQLASANGYGDGSDGTVIFTTSIKSYGNLTTPADYTVSGNTLYLNLNQEYNFVNFILGEGTTLSSTDTSGAVLYIQATQEIIIDGNILLNNILSPGQRTDTWNGISSPSVENGGSGGSGGGIGASTGSSGGSQGSGFGAGGGSGAYRTTNCSNSSGTSGGNGNSGTPILNSRSDTWFPSASSACWALNDLPPTNGAGASNDSGIQTVSYTGTFNVNLSYAGSGFGNSANFATFSHTPVSGSWAWTGTGAGGNGGIAGKAGVHLQLKGFNVYNRGIINLSGTAGGNGGSGANGSIAIYGSPGISYGAAGGGGAGGGGGGNSGDVNIVYQKTLVNTASITLDGGTGGSGGSFGTSSASGFSITDATSGSSGTSGSGGSTIISQEEADVIADFNYTEYQEDSQIYFYDASIVNKSYLTNWDWYVDSTKRSDANAFYYSVSQNQDLNVCLFVDNSNIDANIILAYESGEDYYEDGNFISRIMDAGSSVAWNTINIEGAFGRLPLPDNASQTGDVNMFGNVLLYHFEDSTNPIEDSSGQNNDGTYDGVLYQEPGWVEYSLGFDGVDDNISFSPITLGTWTWAAWVKTDAFSGFWSIPTGDNIGTFIGRSSNNEFRLKDNVTAYTITRAKPVIGEWEHWAVTSNGSVVKFYVDGQYVNQVAQGGANTMTFLDIGDSYSGIYEFTGNIDEYSIWNRVLSNDEILAVYNLAATDGFIQTRSCPDSTCSTNPNFVGPDGTTGSVFNEGYVDLDLNLSNNRYFQYLVHIVSDNNQISPIYFGSTINYAGGSLLDYYNDDFAAGTTIDTNITYPYYYDTTCKDVTAFDAIAPTIDANISFIKGFGQDTNFTYNMTCYDNATPINYLIEWHDVNGETLTIYDSDDANASLKTDVYEFGNNNGFARFTCTDDSGNTAVYNSIYVYGVSLYLVNEKTGELFTVSEINDMNTAIVRTLDGSQYFDFKAESATSTSITSDEDSLIFEFQYKDVLDTVILREIDFSLLQDTNIPVCVANFEQFYLNRFVASRPDREVILYQDQADCYNTVGYTHYVFETVWGINAYTIAKPYLLRTISDDGNITSVSNIDGESSLQHNIDAIDFTLDSFTATIGNDAVGISCLENSITGICDSNTLQINFDAFEDVYTSTKFDIYLGSELLYTYTETITPNQFGVNWYWGGESGLTDQNTLLLVVTSIDEDGDEHQMNVYFNILGEQYSNSMHQIVAFIVSMILILFGLTLVKSQEALGWFGALVCIVALGITAFVIQVWWISLLQAGIITIILYIMFLAKGPERGVV